MRDSKPPGPLSLSEANASVTVPSGAPTWRRWLAVAGPALMVAVGYMDPGNWATDLAAGSRYEYRLLWILVLSNFTALLLQSFAARLGVVRRRDLAQASREAYPPLVNLPLYGLAELGIAACDLAEVIGSAIALQLLFGLPLVAGVLVTTCDVLLLLLLTRFGIRKLEAVVVSLVGTIGLAFLVEIVLARPAWGLMARGLVPSLPDAGALYLGIGILGATVMPHNLYLHSALVQTRRFAGGAGETRRAIRLNNVDTALALNLALFVNAAILVVAAAVFFRTGHHDVVEIQDAHGLLAPLVGTSFASVLFALALLASGQSSTVTGTLAGQIVMEGYLDIRIRPWLRRLATRLLAVGPAIFTILALGDRALGDLLVLSQVILSLQLPFATIPLIHFVSDRRKMGEHAVGAWTCAAGWAAALVVVGLNAALVVQTLGGWFSSGGALAWAARLIAVPVTIVLAVLLAWVTFQPLADKLRGLLRRGPAGEIHPAAGPQLAAVPPPEPLRRAAIAMDFAGREDKLLREALRFIGPSRPELALFHVVESAPARVFGRDAADKEARADAERLEQYAALLRGLGFSVTTALGAGQPAGELARLVGEFGAELVILGGHGHRGLSDLIHGTTAEAVRHRVKASVLVIHLAD